jgi:hypothetical protein
MDCADSTFLDATLSVDVLGFGHGASLRVCLFFVGCRRLVQGLYAGPNVPASERVIFQVWP